MVQMLLLLTVVVTTASARRKLHGDRPHRASREAPPPMNATWTLKKINAITKESLLGSALLIKPVAPLRPTGSTAPLRTTGLSCLDFIVPHRRRRCLDPPQSFHQFVSPPTTTARQTQERRRPCATLAAGKKKGIQVVEDC